MTPPLTDNQTILLRVICAEDGPTTAQLALARKADGGPFGENAARNALKRMEDRGLVLSSGSGSGRRWAATSAGRAHLPPAAEDESAIRRYVVLEELTFAELAARVGDAGRGDELRVYVQVALPEARNTEHAYRQTAKEVYANVDSDPTLVAVATKMWKPTPVRITTRQTVSVG